LARVPPRAPGDVHATLARDLLADGLEQVFDLETPELRRSALGGLVGNGLLLPCGVRSVRFRPPLNLSESEAGAGLEIVRRSLKRL
jgi:L-lysine 6-transaminase